MIVPLALNIQSRKLRKNLLNIVWQLAALVVRCKILSVAIIAPALAALTAFVILAAAPKMLLTISALAVPVIISLIRKPALAAA